MEHTAERLLATAHGVAMASQRRIRVLVVGTLPDGLLGRVLASGSVSHVVRPGESADLAIVGADAGATFDDAGYLAPNGFVVFDPKRTAPIDAIRRARRAWADVQPWVGPLEGDGALSDGVIGATETMRPNAPQVSASMPVRDEAHDVERVLASFLPIAREWVVGVDEKSADGTLAIVERYADVVFRFRIDPWSFAAARNQTLDRCSFPWIFQTEGHEHFHPDGTSAMRLVGALRLPRGVLMVPRDVKAGERGEFDQTFHFPWCFRNHPAIRFRDQNGVHNSIDAGPFSEAVGAKTSVMVVGDPEIRTVHKAHPENRRARHTQAVEMNRDALRATVAEGGEKHVMARALFYEMQESARAGDCRGAVRAGIKYARIDDPFGEQRYEGLISLGEYLLSLERKNEEGKPYHCPKPLHAIRVLRRALGIDLNRVEAEVLLADAHQMIGDLSTAKQLYAKATGVPAPAYANLFIRRRYYEAGPWIGLAFVCEKMGEIEDARAAARMALHFEPGHPECARIAEPAESAA